MANDTTANPWVLDTAGVISTGLVTILEMLYKPSAAADDLTVLDNGGKTIWDVNALAAAEVGNETFSVPGYTANGFNLSVIDGGTLYVWIK